MTEPVIIEAAINGATRKAKNPNVPISPEEIAADALAVFDAGAAIVHNHIDIGPVDGATSAKRYLEGWAPVFASRPDALIYPTVNFGTKGEALFDHLEPLAESGRLRFGVLDPGSVNFGRLQDGVPAGSFVYTNTPDTIRSVFDLCARLGIGPSLAIYEPGFLRATMLYWQAGRLPAGTLIKLYFSEGRGLTGVPFGLPPTVKALEAYLELLEGCPVPWAVSVVGGDIGRHPIAREALRRGGHLHLGLEFYGGPRTPTNRELVEEAVQLCAEEGRPVATCAQAAELLGLPDRAR